MIILAKNVRACGPAQLFILFHQKFSQLRPARWNKAPMG